MVGKKKSRNGCQRCKQRRVKCDEQAPCSRCVRRGEECSLAAPPPPSASLRHPSSNDEVSEAAWLQDLELLHHYTTAGYAMASVKSDQLRLVWKETVPLMAMQHPYLMHGVLASSAMHLAYLRPSESRRYLQLCDQHQMVAVSRFREQLNSVTSNNAPAIFALSALLSVAALARMLPRVTKNPRESPEDILEHLVEVIALTRGSRDVLEMGFSWVRERLHQLSELCIDTCPDALQRDACLEALQHLRRIYDTVCTLDENQLEIGHIMHWFVMPSARFVDMLRAGRSIAVLILCHFWLLWASFRHLWYVQDLASSTLPFLEDMLEEHHRPWVEWVKVQLSDGMPCLESPAGPSSAVPSISTPGTNFNSESASTYG